MQYYILSYFRKERATSLSQILHVFHAKRTPSMFYMIEINHWHHGFSLSNTVKREDLKQVIQMLLQKHFLIEEDKGYILTEVGAEKQKTYFKDHYYPKSIKNFENANVRQPFWSRLQLFAQVFSELSYQNAQYAPVIKHPHHQENVRQLFQQFSAEKKEILDQWIFEQDFLFSKLETQEANVLASQLTGHGVIGETNSQLAEALQMTISEFHFYQQDVIERLIHFIQKYQSDLNLMPVILKQTHKETNFGLSMSTRHTYELLQQGHGALEIARLRSIKENTVREHILEMAFVFPNFPYAQFIPENIYEQLHQQFKNKQDYNYRQAMTENDALEFMHFRLVELERMRGT